MLASAGNFSAVHIRQGPRPDADTSTSSMRVSARVLVRMPIHMPEHMPIHMPYNHAGTRACTHALHACRYAHPETR